MTGWETLDQLLDDAPGDFSACVQDREGCTAYAYAADVVRPAASLIKVPLAMALVASDRSRRSGGAGSDLNTIVTLREEDRVQGDGAWEGSFDVAPAGTTRTLWELIDHALRESDNTAANLLIAAIGMDEVNCFLRAAPYHLEATCLRRRFMDRTSAAAGRENLTTAREMCVLLRELDRAEVPFDRLILSLERSASVDALVAGLPAGARVAHKVGELPGIEHDVGIVYAPDCTYVVGLLSQHLVSADQGRATIREASKMIYRHMARGHGG